MIDTLASWKGGTKLDGHKHLSMCEFLPYNSTGIRNEDITCKVELPVMNECVFMCIMNSNHSTM